MSDYIYREITKRDIDQLYASRDAEKWLIPHYASKRDNESVKRHMALAEPNTTTAWKIFLFLEDHERADEIADWYVYLDEDGSTLIMQVRFPMPPHCEMYSIDADQQQFVVLYCSEVLKNNIQQICQLVVEVATSSGGKYLTGDPESDFWEDPIISYKIAAPNDYGRYK